MLNKITKQLKHGEKGFTLIELLVVVAILGILAAVAIPNVSRFMNYGRSGMKATELKEVQNCVVAAMSENPPITQITPAAHFGNTAHSSPPSGDDLTITDGSRTRHLTDYIVGGIVKCLGDYSVDQYGSVTQNWYPTN